MKPPPNGLSVECPLCDAPTGQYCTTKHYGARRTRYLVVMGVHKSRMTKALKHPDGACVVVRGGK